MCEKQFSRFDFYFSKIQLWSVLGVKHKKPCALAGIEELVAVSLLSTPTAESFKSPQEFY